MISIDVVVMNGRLDGDAVGGSAGWAQHRRAGPGQAELRTCGPGRAEPGRAKPSQAELTAVPLGVSQARCPGRAAQEPAGPDVFKAGSSSPRGSGGRGAGAGNPAEVFHFLPRAAVRRCLAGNGGPAWDGAGRGGKGRARPRGLRPGFPRAYRLGALESGAHRGPSAGSPASLCALYPV